MRTRTGGHVLDADGRWVVRSIDQGPARARLAGSFDGGYVAVSVNDSAEQRHCSICGAAFASKESLATHRWKKHREAT